MSGNEITEIFSEKLKRMLNTNHMSNKELAEKLNVSPSTVSMWITKNNSPRMDMMKKIADCFNVSPSYLMSPDDKPASPKRKGVVINVYERVVPDVPLEMTANIIDTEEIMPEMAETGNFFGLKIKDDRMAPRIEDGDVVIVRQQDDAMSGDVVIAAINGAEATCKRLRKYRDGIELIANNPSYAPVFFSNEDILNRTVCIIGKVVELRGKF